MTDLDARLEREQQYHNQRYKNASRDHQNEFYFILDHAFRQSWRFHVKTQGPQSGIAGDLLNNL